ncbi:lipase family protein [Streptomyces sp. NPDC050448]|uniref:lipase family protein n=1 Tax=Streptomyces sp. NPDC050448 TaxID=3155404 RepID=UPI003436D851
MPAPTTFDHQARDYSPQLAYWMARAAALAYQDEARIDAEARAWGFDQVRHHRTRFTPPFPLEDTQAYTMAGDHMIVVAFRGTEPVQLKDWLSDVTTPPWPGPAGTGYVHYGFAEALQSVFPEIAKGITELRDRGQTVFLSGHSLGGALAMLTGARLHLEDPRLRADGVYTYGQPRTCDRMLAKAYNTAFAKRMYRFVNNNDIVPQLPPEPVFHHVDALRYIDADGRLREAMPMLQSLGDRAKGLTADLFAPASDGVRDHSIVRYVGALEKNLP